MDCVLILTIVTPANKKWTKDKVGKERVTFLVSFSHILNFLTLIFIK